MATVACIDGERLSGKYVRQSVRNMVINLENVLGNLQGVVGDLRVLLNQIDTVSNKLDERYGADWRYGTRSGNSTTISKTIPSTVELELSNGVISTASFHVDNNKFIEVSPELDFSFLGISNNGLCAKWGGCLGNHISIVNDSNILMGYNFPQQPPLHQCSTISEEEETSMSISNERDINQYQNNDFHRYSGLEQTKTHIYCDHAYTDGKENGYCGIYERAMESQLENSCNVSDTYISDSDFEDDEDISSSESSMSLPFSDETPCSYNEAINTWVAYTINHTLV